MSFILLSSLQAFDISQELGIACPLTPDMMLLRDIPDKLAVTAFVYQMYNYFTMAVPSAIIKPMGATSKDEDAKNVPTQLEGLKSFDFSEIEKLTCKNLSPTTKEGELASQRNLSGNKWSKHSLKEEQEQLQQTEQSSYNHSSEGVAYTPEKIEPINRSEPITHSTPVSTIPDMTSYSTSTVSSSSLSDETSSRVDLTSVKSGPPLPDPNYRGSNSSAANTTGDQSSTSLTVASRSDLSLPLSSVSVNSVNSKNSPVGTPTKVYMTCISISVSAVSNNGLFGIDLYPLNPLYAMSY